MRSSIRWSLTVIASLVALGCTKAAPPPPPDENAAPLPPPTQTTQAAAIKPAAAAADEPTQSNPNEIPAPADVAAPPKQAKKTASGLATLVLTKGTGKAHPAEQDKVRVHYTGWTKDGKMFDSSVVRGEPAQFGVTGVIKGWTEALQLMVEGEKRRLWIPADLAYGEVARRPGAPTGQLTFDVELIEVIPAPPPPPVPKDVAKPPANAKKTATGLYYRSLEKGTGTAHPSANSRVRVHYTGWTKDGKMFDSSVVRGEPTTFSLKQVIPGWTEGVQLMVEGEKMRFWIPGDLAYGDTPKRPGTPSGQLTFDIELIKIY